MSTNRVGDGQRAERRIEEDRRDGRQQGAAREEKRSFSKMMQKREMPSGERRGDERGRKLREGTVQTGRRKELARHGERRHSQRMQSAQHSQSVQEGRRGGEKGACKKKESATVDTTGGGGETSGNEDKDGAEIRSVSLGGENCWRATDDAVREIDNRAHSFGEANAMEASKGKHTAIEEVARQIVEAVRVGEDSRARRVVFLDVTVPGRGEVRIRLRRDGGGMEVRMRADNDALARSLQQGVGALRQKGAQRDIQFTSVQVVR